MEVSDITGEQISQICRDLVATGRAQTIINEGDGDRRLVFMADMLSSEIMVALEKGGCIFLTPTDHVDKFLLIQHGFHIIAAEQIAFIFSEIANEVSKKNQRETEQIRKIAFSKKGN